MKTLWFLPLFLLTVSLTLAQKQEPGLVLPVGHTGMVKSAVFSPDGSIILTASLDNTARLWDAKSGKLLKTLEGHDDFVNTAVFSPDGTTVLTASEDKTARIWDAKSGIILKSFVGHKSGVRSAVFSPDGSVVLTASKDSTANLWKVKSGKLYKCLSAHSGILSTAVFSPDGSTILTASSDSSVRLWDAKSGKLKRLKSYNNKVRSAVFSPDGKLALTAIGDNTARIFEVATGKELQVLRGHTSWVTSAVFSPDGSTILTSSWDHTLRIWDVNSGKLLLNLASILDLKSGQVLQNWELQIIRFNSAIFSPGGDTILTTSDDETARIWDAKTGKHLKTLNGHTIDVNSGVFSRDGSAVLTASMDGVAPIWGTKSGKLLKCLGGHTKGATIAVYSPDGSIVITALFDDRILRIWDVSTGKELQVLEHTSRLNSAVFSPDGSTILTSSWDDTLRIWDVNSGKLLKNLYVPTGFVNSAVFSPDGSTILITAKPIRGIPMDNTVRILDTQSGKLLQNLFGHTGAVNSALFSPDCSVVLSASNDSTSHIWDVSTGKELQVLSGHTDWVNSAVFSPDGKWALTASNDNTARLWDVSTGKELQVLKGHTSSVNRAVFSPDGRHVLTTGDDHKTIFWDVATGKALYTRLQLEGGDWLVYDEHYRFDGTPGAIDYLYLTCGLEVIDLAQVKDSLWVPGLVEKIMNGDSILIHDRPAPKLKDLNICELTPVIEPLENGDKGLYRYKIIPRNGGLGETEVYINGNLTYKFKPEQLQKKLEQKKEVYYLTFSSDTLQGFLTGEKNNANPILVKAKVKGSGIYGRGVVLDVVKTTEKENPKFFGVFIGVNDYGNPTKESSAQRYRDLDFAKKDADDLSNAVEATARNLFKEDCRIYRLTGTGNSDSVPSKANLQNVLKEIGENAKASDILYIFFAGHGDISEKSGEKEIRFILHKADKKNVMSTSFGVDELTEWCHPKNIKAQKRVLVFDACHSGQIINQTMEFNGRGDDEATRIRQLDRLKDKNGMMILAAAADNESAYEDETLNQGVLTYHLLQVMKEQPKDTSLEIRSWFDETIDLVKDYSRANGNQQEPNSFGDGRFEIGNITNEVRQSIDISCPKTRIGMCDITMNPEAKVMYPQLRQKINEFFISSSSRGELVYSKNLEKSYRIVASCNVRKKKAEIYFDVFIGETQLSEAISLPATKGQTEEELVAQLAQSITAEIERLDKRDEKCKSKKK